MKKFLAALLVLMLSLSVIALPTLAEGENMILTAIADDPETMDPTLCSWSRSSRVLQNLFKGLYKLDADGVTYVPAMAESYVLSDDGLTYTFTLRDGMVWSDGSPLTAYDFEYSWLRVLDPEVNSNCASDLWVVKNGKAYYNGECGVEEVGVKALDEKTFEVVVETPTPWLINLTATTSFFPVCKAVVEANENWTTDIATYICNGPFMLQEYSSLSRLVMVPNPNYYCADEIKIDGVVFNIIPEAEAELTAYKNGELNVSGNLNGNAVAQFAGTDEFHTSGKIGIQYCDFNCQLPEFSDKRVRQAFAMAIDRNALLDALGIVEPAVYGFVPYAQPALTDPTKSYREIAGDMFSEDVAAAQALLAEAGYPNGEGFPVVQIVTKNDPTQKLMAQIIGEMWKANLGIQYEPDTRESSVYWSDLADGKFSVDRNGYTCDYTYCGANLAIWVTGSNASENGWDDPVYDEMYTNTLYIVDPAEREAALIECEKYLVDQMPGMPMYSYDNQYLVKPEVNGVICNAIGHIYYEYCTIG